MGWWGYGIYDGNSPQDALYGIGVAVFGREKFDRMLDNDERCDTMAVLRDHAQLICKNATRVIRYTMRPSRGRRCASEIIAVATALNELGVKRFGKKFDTRLRIAFECEHEEAADFDNPRARRAALKRAKEQLGLT